MNQASPLVAANSAVAGDLETEEDGLPRTKTYDAALFDILKVSADDLANQLTLIDLPLFQAIPPEELTSCSWTAKKKFEITPHVVNFTRRFNHVSFWVTREVLNANTAKMRAELISHFVRVAKKLLELNNLHSLKAIVSGLQSAPIFRLTRTWNFVPRKDREKLDRLNELVSEEDNSTHTVVIGAGAITAQADIMQAMVQRGLSSFRPPDVILTHERAKLRAYLESVRLPCIPYLGMYLTDLTYINTVHPSTGGLDTERSNKMNVLLRTIADFQQSYYDLICHFWKRRYEPFNGENIEPVPHIQKYLMSVKYIEELQKFMEDDNYKLSLKIEPNAVSPPRLKQPRQSVTAVDDIRRHTTTSEGVGLKSSALWNIPDRSGGGSLGRNFTPGHRKAKSLGNSSMINLSHSLSNCSSSSAPAECRNLLDDSMKIEEKNTSDLHLSTSYDSGLDHDEPESHPIIQSFECHEGDELTPVLPDSYFRLQGFLKRKVFLKNGQKPRVSSWHRYWVGLTGSCLVFFLPKYRGFGGHDRGSFRMDPHKVTPLYNWGVIQCGSESHRDLFQLIDESGVNVYRYLAGSTSNANLWCRYIREAIEGGLKPLHPPNLMTFDDSEEEEDTRL